MFFKDLSQIPTLAKSAETVIFAISPPALTEVNIKPYFILNPDEKNKIPVEATRELIEACTLKQSKDTYIIINHAETMREEAQNALLKLLEEPRENYHFLLYTENPTALLPTIRSRAEIYYQIIENPLSTPVNYPDDIKNAARDLLKLTPRDLPAFATTLTKKKKDDLRPRVLAILAAAIEISYKSYFATKNPAFLTKLPNLLDCQENIARNGHIKLHLIADLI